MTTFLLNSLPNPVLLAGLEEGGSREITVWPEDLVRRSLRTDFVSAVGHESTAALFSERTGVDIQANRINFSPEPGDLVIAGLFRSPRRLAVSEMWSEKEILAMPITWVAIMF